MSSDATMFDAAQNAVYVKMLCAFPRHAHARRALLRACMHMRARTRTCAHLRVRACMHACIRMRSHERTHARAHTRSMFVRLHACAHIHRYLHFKFLHPDVLPEPVSSEMRPPDKALPTVSLVCVRVHAHVRVGVCVRACVRACVPDVSCLP